MQKIGVECKTCDVSDSFYSSMSVKVFRLEHAGHEVIEGRIDAPAASQRAGPSNGRQSIENSGKVKLLKVLVELVVLPTYPVPVFTITGVKEDLKSAFVHVISPNQRDQVKETLERGKYLDYGADETVYTWEPKAISFSEDANQAMSLSSTALARANFTRPELVTDGPSRSEVPPTSAKVEEIQIDVSGEERPALETDEVTSESLNPAPTLPSNSVSSPLSSSAKVFVPAPTFTQSSVVAASHTLRKRASAKTTSESRRVSPPEKSETTAAVAPKDEGSRDAGVEEDNYLLVSKSWYIEGGAKNKSEAVRISRLLRPFRWTVEPAYTIGVIVDDILSVETASDDIGGDMLKQIENAGYKLSRVSMQKGRPVAWFKKLPVSEQGSAES